jgi:hypothetical protein
VGVLQRLEHLGHQPYGLADAQRPVAREHLLERLAGHVREDGIELAVLRLPGVDQLDDVGVRERRADPGLAAEALDLAPRRGLRPLARAQQLDRDRLTRGELSRLIDPPEAARPELAEDLVPVLEAGPLRERRGVALHSASGPGAQTVTLH